MNKTFNILLFITTLVFISFNSLVYSQPKIDKGLNQIKSEDIKSLLTFLSADELEGRGTGYLGNSVAAKFLETQFRLAGLSPFPGQSSMMQKFSLIETKKDQPTILTILGKQKNDVFNLLKEFLVISNHPNNLSVNIPLIFAGYAYKNPENNYNDFNSVNVKGKIVVALSALPKFVENQSANPFVIFRSIQQRANWAEEEGAAGIIFIDDQFVQVAITKFADLLNQPKAWLTEPNDTFFKIIADNKIAESIFSANGMDYETQKNKFVENNDFEMLNLKSVNGKFNLTVDKRNISSNNVIAYLEGKDPKLKNEVVVVGAHFDHLGKISDDKIFNGADDNGSGTVAMLEIAKALSSARVNLKRSILFIGFSAEELGELGSEFYVHNSIIPLRDTYAMINLDMIGRNSEDSVFVIGSNFSSLALHQFTIESLKLTKLIPDFTYNSIAHPERLYFRSDQFKFAEKNVPIVYLTSGNHNDYHQITDTVEKINFSKITKISKAVFLISKKLANNPGSLEKDGILYSKVK